MPSAVEKEDYICKRYGLRESVVISLTDIRDDVELETGLQLIHEEIFAPKAATNWWRKTRKPNHLNR